VKKLLSIIILLVLAYGAYTILTDSADSPMQLFDSVFLPEPVGTPSGGSRRTGPAGDASQAVLYAPALRTLTEQVFGPLRKDAGSRIDVQSVWTAASEKRRAGHMSDAELRAVETIVNLLNQAMAERNRYEKAYRDLSSKPISTMEKEPGRKRNFFLSEQQRQWTVYADGARPRVRRELEQLDRLEAR
jgi:hypothetical protein